MGGRARCGLWEAGARSTWGRGFRASEPRTVRRSVCGGLVRQPQQLNPLTSVSQLLCRNLGAGVQRWRKPAKPSAWGARERVINRLEIQ